MIINLILRLKLILLYFDFIYGEINAIDENNKF